jgi:hypothetical protein
MYPLGLASPKEDENGASGEFYFLLREAVCKGFGETHTQTVSEWLDSQGINEYNRMGELFKDITLHPFFQSGENLTPQKVEMFFMVCYNIDEFRKFVFGSTFLDKFEVDDAVRDQIEKDDVALLEFGYQWLRFALFAENTMTIKSDIRADKEKELRMKRKLP